MFLCWRSLRYQVCRGSQCASNSCGHDNPLQSTGSCFPLLKDGKRQRSKSLPLSVPALPRARTPGSGSLLSLKALKSSGLVSWAESCPQSAVLRNLTPVSLFSMYPPCHTDAQAPKWSRHWWEPVHAMEFVVVQQACPGQHGARPDEEANLSYMQSLLWRHGTRSHKCPTVTFRIMNSQSCPRSSHAFSFVCWCHRI